MVINIAKKKNKEKQRLNIIKTKVKSKFDKLNNVVLNKSKFVFELPVDISIIFAGVYNIL